jgi:hypothetical protein
MAIYKTTTEPIHQIKHKREMLPHGFSFVVMGEEVALMRSQIATASKQVIF